MIDVNDQYSIIEKMDKLELKEISLLVVAKQNGKYANKNWNDYSKLAAYLIKEFCNSGYILNTTTAQLKKAIEKDNADVNKIIKRLTENGYVEKYPKLVYSVRKNTSGKESRYNCSLTKSEYSLIPADKLLDLLDEYNFVYPDREIICQYREKALKSVEKKTVLKTKENGIDVTITNTTDAYGNKMRKKEIDVEQAKSKLDSLHEEEFNINLDLAYNGQEEYVETTKPLVNIENNCEDFSDKE